MFNDFVIPSTDAGIGKRHFIIKYNLDNKSYYLRDLGDGSGTFVRLDVPLVNFLVINLIDIETWLYYIIWGFSYGGIVLFRFQEREKLKNLT